MSENHSQNVGEHKDQQQTQHNDLYHWVYACGTTVLVGVIDFVFLWPESHLAALLALAAWLSLVAVHELRRFPQHVTVSTIVFLFVAVPIINFVVDALTPVPERIVTGTLQPASDPRPQTGCDPAGPDAYWSPFGGFIRFKVQRPKEPPPKDAILVTLGNNGIIVTKTEKVPVVQIADCNLLSIQKTSNGLLVNASVFDLQGKLEAFIRDNAFTAIERGDSTPQQGDLSTMVVRDQNIERLWVHFANPSTVQVRGIFFCPRSSSNVIFVDKDIRMVPAAGPAEMMTVVTSNACVTDKPLGYLPPG